MASPRPGFGIRSTTCVAGFARAVATGTSRPVDALRPIGKDFDPLAISDSVVHDPFQTWKAQQESARPGASDGADRALVGTKAPPRAACSISAYGRRARPSKSRLACLKYGWDSNPRRTFALIGFGVRRLKPLEPPCPRASPGTPTIWAARRHGQGPRAEGQGLRSKATRSKADRERSRV